MAKAKTDGAEKKRKELPSGILCGDNTYTQHSLGSAIGRTSEWVIDNVVEKGCPAKEDGWLWLISERDFRQWVENGALAKVKAK